MGSSKPTLELLTSIRKIPRLQDGRG